MRPGVQETTTTTGTGTLTLAAVTGRVRFAQAFAVGDIVPYAINAGTDWEWGWGRVEAANTLARSKIVATYVSGTYDDTAPTAITLPSGTANVYCTDTGGAYGAGLPMVASAYGRKAIFSAHLAFTATTSLTCTADRLLILPFKVDGYFETSGVYLDLNTNAASSKARVGIYRIDTTGQPAEVLRQTADIDTSVATGVLNAAWSGGNLVLPPGWYGLGFVASHAIVVSGYATNAAQTITPFGIDSGAGVMTPILLLFKAIAGWSALPDSPTSLSKLAADGASNLPFVALQVA